MIILGIDPGSTHAGYGVIDFSKNKPSYIDGGIVSVDSKDKNIRLVELEQSFEKIIKKYKPDIVGIERLYFVKNQKTGLEVAQSRGVLLLSVAKRRLPVFEFTPNEIKHGITGYGSADKKAVTKMVRQILKIGDLNQPDDAYDALAIALMAGYNQSRK
jgi:crossover junction endodeoxyribonuclease RuvC